MINKKFSKEIYGDVDGIYMSCPEEVSKHLAEKLSCYKTGVELCCALGMTVIQLAKKMEYVYGIDMDENRINAAIKNSELYNVRSKTEFILGDVLDENILRNIKAEVAVLDPDWSIGENKKNHVFDLEMTQPNMKELFYKVKENITENIVLRIPKTFSFDTLKVLGNCEIENIIWDNKVKFRYAYFSKNIKENKETNSYFNMQFDNNYNT